MATAPGGAQRLHRERYRHAEPERDRADAARARLAGARDHPGDPRLGAQHRRGSRERHARRRERLPRQEQLRSARAARDARAPRLSYRQSVASGWPVAAAPSLLKNELSFQKLQIIQRVNEAFGEKVIREVVIN